MSDDVNRVQGPSAEGPRYKWKPRLSSSDLVCHSSVTDPPPGIAENDIRRTAVGAGTENANVRAANVMSPPYWKSRMSVRIWFSTGVVT
jgi:hypothetical protein